MLEKPSTLCYSLNMEKMPEQPSRAEKPDSYPEGLASLEDVQEVISFADEVIHRYGLPITRADGSQTMLCRFDVMSLEDKLPKAVEALHDPDAITVSLNLRPKENEPRYEFARTALIDEDNTEHTNTIGVLDNMSLVHMYDGSRVSPHDATNPAPLWQVVVTAREVHAFIDILEHADKDTLLFVGERQVE